MRLAEKLAWSLLSSGLLLVVLAVASHRTGKHVLTSTGAGVNTHAPATWVLASFGAVLVINSFALFSWVSEQKTVHESADSRGSDTTSEPGTGTAT